MKIDYQVDLHTLSGVKRLQITARAARLPNDRCRVIQILKISGEDPKKHIAASHVYVSEIDKIKNVSSLMESTRGCNRKPKTGVLTARCPIELIEQVKAMAAKQDVSVSEFITDCLMMGLEDGEE